MTPVSLAGNLVGWTCKLNPFIPSSRTACPGTMKVGGIRRRPSPHPAPGHHASSGSSEECENIQPVREIGGETSMQAWGQEVKGERRVPRRRGAGPGGYFVHEHIPSRIPFLTSSSGLGREAMSLSSLSCHRQPRPLYRASTAARYTHLEHRLLQLGLLTSKRVSRSTYLVNFLSSKRIPSCPLSGKSTHPSECPCPAARRRRALRPRASQAWPCPSRS